MRSVLITGASTGIGAACAVGLAADGFRVFAGVRAAEDEQRLRAEAAGTIVPVMIDVTDQRSIHAAVETVTEAVGDEGLAGLVNNAGVVVSGPLEVVPLDELRRQLEVNVVGQVAVIQAFLPLLRAARGRIVNMSSANGALSSPYLGPYSASKHALEAITDALRLELRQWGIYVSSVAPGPIATPIWEKAQAAADQLIERVDRDRFEPYRADIDKFREYVTQSAANAMPVDRVVRAVQHALTAPRPRTRYFIDWPTRLCFKAFRMVPDRIRDWVVRREIGLS